MKAGITGIRLFQTLLYSWLKIFKKIADLRLKILENLAQRWIFDGVSWIEVLHNANTALSKEKQIRIDGITDQQKIIYFTFREYHFLDWFLPIYRALIKRFPDKYAIFCIDFGSTLRNVGNRYAYWEYHQKILQRFSIHKISTSAIFSDQEIGLYTRFPAPDLIITSETIRKELFTCKNRIYLPHYCVPKAKDTLPKKISYNHVFLPTRPPFTYPEISAGIDSEISIHQVGYPKNQSQTQPFTPEFDADQPLVIYAPSLEEALIFPALKAGILDVFKKMTDLNFMIKLHPTLSSKMQNVRRLIEQLTRSSSHIKIDSLTSIQDMGSQSTALITDFGSVGAEFRLRFLKRVIYLKVPVRFEGGADLHFRDQFADEVTHVDGLEKAIRAVVKKGDLKPSEGKEMIQQVLYHPETADQYAADKIDDILSIDTQLKEEMSGTRYHTSN